MAFFLDLENALYERLLFLFLAILVIIFAKSHPSEVASETFEADRARHFRTLIPPFVFLMLITVLLSMNPGLVLYFLSTIVGQILIYAIVLGWYRFAYYDIWDFNIALTWPGAMLICAIPPVVLHFFFASWF